MPKSPAVYTNGAYKTFVYYSGEAPWTGDTLTTLTSLASLDTTGSGANYYDSEHWAALVNSSGDGLAVYVPDSLPFVVGFYHLGSGGTGPTDDATSYFRLCTPGFYTLGTIQEGDVFLIVGKYTDARSIIYQLTADNPPLNEGVTGKIVSPVATSISETVPVAGWVVSSKPVSTINVLIDSNIALTTTPTATGCSGVQSGWPNAPFSGCFTASLDATTLTLGTHTLMLQAVDPQGNAATFGVEKIEIANQQ